MSNSGFLPRKDAELLAWSLNFKNLIQVNYAMYGLLEAQSTFYSGLHTTFAAKLQLATEPGTRTRVTVNEKDAAREALKTNARFLAKIIEGQVNVTDAQKLELGLNVRKQPTPIPVPTAMPDIDIVDVVGNTVTVRVHDAADENRRRPVGAKGAAIYSYVGPTPPGADGAWVFVGNAQKSNVYPVTFPNTVEPGSLVWITAAWYNPRAEFGPAATPRSTYTQFGGTMSEQGALKAAA